MPEDRVVAQDAVAALQQIVGAERDERAAEHREPDPAEREARQSSSTAMASPRKRTERRYPPR